MIPTPEAARAQTETARLTYAVPAEEETKRAKEETRRSGHVNIRHGITAAVAVLLAVLAYNKLDGGNLVAVWIALAGFLVVDNSLHQILERLKKVTALTQKS
jgi:hypothetical protein